MVDKLVLAVSTYPEPKNNEYNKKQRGDASVSCSISAAVGVVICCLDIVVIDTKPRSDQRFSAKEKCCIDPDGHGHIPSNKITTDLLWDQLHRNLIPSE